MNSVQPVGRILKAGFLAIEEVLIALPVEWMLRLRQWLDPRVHKRELRIRATHKGKERKGKTFFVFVIYAEGALPAFTKNLIDAVARSAHDLMLVSNAPLEASERDQLLHKAQIIIERENVGRDFGAYKDGIEHILENYPGVGRIVILNDSVFFMEEGLDQLIERLGEGAEFIGVTESSEYRYHVQSFALSFGPAAIASTAFRRFWRKYLPIATRQWAIMRGELALTRAMLGAGFTPVILFTANLLKSKLLGATEIETLAAVRMVPTLARAAVLRRLKSEKGSAPQDITAAIVGEMEGRNQMHFGGFLLARYAQLPMLKRDMVFRKLYTLEAACELIGALPTNLRAEMIADLMRTGNATPLRGLQRILFRHGMR